MTQIIINETTPVVVEVSTPGPQGSSGTATVGTVTTGASGSAAAVTNSGTPSAAVFNFTIPKGDIGDVTPAATAAKNAAEAAATAAAASELAAETAEQAAEDFATAALASANQSSASASTATTKAQEATTSAANAAASAQSVSTAATTANTKAQEAAASAAAALSSANTATAKAQEAAGSATTADTKAQEAVVSATTATNKAAQASANAATALSAQQVTTDNATLAIAQAGIASSKASAANTSANDALVQASVATAQAAEATTQATTATTQAGIATTQATTASTQAGIATTQANTAIAQADIATTKASEASVSASNSQGSALAALASQTASAASAAAANTSAGNASGSAASALAIYGTAAAQQTALTNAQSAASLAQGYALSASSAIQQDLSGVTAQAIHRSPNAVTAMFVYDTSKDSDGGAWTEKCQHTSWYNEALNGKWLGAQASESSARYEGAALGSELLSSATLPWQRGFLSVNGTISASGGLITITQGSSDSSSFRWVQPITCVIGKVYRVYAQDIRSSVGTGMFALSANSAGTGITGDNSITDPQDPSARYVVATATTMYAVISLNGGSTGSTATIGNISVREVTALTTASGDYYQSTVDGKFYRLWKNLLSYTDSFASTYWTKAPGVMVTDSVGYSTINVPSTVGAGANIVYKQGLANGTVALQLQVRGAAGTSITLNTDSGSQSVAFNGDWQTISFSVTGTAHHFYIKTVAANQTYSFDVRRAQLEYGSTATAYEAKTVDGSVSETFRGNKADFPRLAGIVAEAQSVTIYDLTEAGRPMWMRFVGGSNSTTALGYDVGTRPISSVSAINGRLLNCGANGGGAAWTSFANDHSTHAQTQTFGGVFILHRPVSVRNVLNFPSAGTTVSVLGLPSTTCNAIAATVLPDAPVDAVTGLQVPTIACLVGDSQVSMADGSTQRIDQVKIGSKVKTLEGYSLVTGWFDQGVKEVFEFEFDGGQKLTCTADHKIRTTIGWVEAGSLTAEHEVVGL